MLQSLLVSGYNEPQKHKDSTGHSHIHSLNMFFREVAAIQGFKNMHCGLYPDISITSGRPSGDFLNLFMPGLHPLN